MKWATLLKKPKIFLIIILFLAIFLRIINLANWPISFNQDEALNGYEAYSILKTGKDHRGNLLPVFFEGFSDKVDNRLPLYIYATIPSVALFGLNKFATRLPAVIFGFLTILFTYFLTKELFKKEPAALLAAFFLALSPWHIFLSRIGLEGIAIPFFSVLTLFLFLKGLKGEKIFILLSGASLGFLFYTYHPAKLFAPLLGLLLLIIYRKELKENKKWILFSFLIFLVVSFPFLFIQLSQWSRIQGRFNQVSILNFPFWPALLIYNFLTYFTPKFLLNHFPLFILIFSLIGFYFLIKLIKQKEFKLLLGLFLVSLVPVSLVLSNPHSYRSISLIPFIEIMAAAGCLFILNKTSKVKFNSKIGYFFLAFIFIILLPLNLLFLSKNHYPYNFLNGFYRYVPEEIIDYIKKNQNKYNQIVFTNKTNQPYIYFLFYLKYPPQKFQSLKIERKYIAGDLQTVESFDKYQFNDIDNFYSPEENNLYIARADEIPLVKAKKIFYHPLDGSIFRIITND